MQGCALQRCTRTANGCMTSAPRVWRVSCCTRGECLTRLARTLQPRIAGQPAQQHDGCSVRGRERRKLHWGHVHRLGRAQYNRSAHSPVVAHVFALAATRPLLSGRESTATWCYDNTATQRVPQRHCYAALYCFRSNVVTLSAHKSCATDDDAQACPPRAPPRTPPRSPLLQTTS